MPKLFSLAITCLFIVSLAFTLSKAALADGPARLVSVKKIWSQAPHNAFTDLLWHDGRWYCVFREGQAHVSPDGALRVLTSLDGETWKSAALITAKDADLRDAKISVSPEGKLVLCGAGALHDKSKATHQSYLWYSDDGEQWGDAIPVGEPDYWLWRITWHGKQAYGVGYATGKERNTRLYKSDDGRKFTPLTPSLYGEGYPNEASLLFTSADECLGVLRRDDKSPHAQLGIAAPPYDDWQWKSLGVQIGGPQILKVDDGRILIAGRDYIGKATTRLWLLDPATAKLTELVTLPSGGDTSYPGLVYRDGLVWLSYYSQHEGKASIYLAKIQLPAKATETK